MAELDDLTSALQRAGRGETGAEDDLLELVYAQLHHLAQARMAREASGALLQPTALVHEVYLRVANRTNLRRYENRAHFFGAAARAMRQILVDEARRRGLARHSRSETIARAIAAPGEGPSIEEMLDLEAALQALETHDPRKAEVVQLRCFAGLTHQETAEVLGVSLGTVEREWRLARAYLQRAITDGPNA